MKTEEEIKLLLDDYTLKYAKLMITLFDQREKGMRGRCWEYSVLHYQDTINLLRNILGLTEITEWDTSEISDKIWNALRNK